MFLFRNTPAKLLKFLDTPNIFDKKNAFLAKKTVFLAFWPAFCMII